MEEIGQVFISVKEAKSLSLNEPTDVYCIIQLEQQKVRTSVCSHVSPNSRAEWSEGYTFDATTDADVNVKVWGKSPSFPRGRLLGSVTIPAATARNRAPVETWLALSPPPGGGGSCGELFFKTSYIASTNKVGYEDFTVLKLIGKGAFGRVMLVRKNDTGRLYAMKQLEKDHVLSLAAVTFTLTERNVLKTFNHPFVVSLKYSFQTKAHLFMVLDYVGGGELFYHMAERGVFDEDTVRFYAAQIVLALGFLHDHAVTYRDLKPENLLLDINGNICLCDFGLCKEQVDGENTFTLCGSPEYMAPEVLQGKGYGRSVDWWALGILIYEMLTGLPPFYSEDPVEMGQNILTAPIHFPDHLSKNIMGLIVQLLRRDPSRRLGSGPDDAEDIKAHPFFASVDWKKIIRKEIEPPFKPHLSGNLDVTYFDPNCTEAPVGSGEDVRAGTTPDDADAFAQFSFVAPSDFGSTPAQRKLAPSPALSFSHLGALHSSSPARSFTPHSFTPHSFTPHSFTPHSFTSQTPTPTPPHHVHPLMGNFPRSQATTSLASLSSSNHSSTTIIASSSPHNSFTMDDVDRGREGVIMTRGSYLDDASPPNFTPHHHHPLQHSSPLPSSKPPTSHSLYITPQPLHANNIAQRDSFHGNFQPRDPAHPLRDISPPVHPPDLNEELPPHPVEENNTSPWTISHAPPPHSLSNPAIPTTNQPKSPTAFTPYTINTNNNKNRNPLLSSTSSPDLLRSQRAQQGQQQMTEVEQKEREEKDDRKKLTASGGAGGKKFQGFMSLFKKIK